MTKLLIALLILISVPVLLGTAQEAEAAALFLRDNVEGQITLQACQFELGITQPFNAGSCGGITVPGETITFEGGWLVNRGGSPDPGSGILYIIDACTGKVSDIITASWITQVRGGFDRARITVTLQSSPDGADLGDVPAGFTGISIRTFDIQASFQDPTTAARVNIPTNLGIRFFDVQEPCPIEVDIDIKPGSDPSSVNCKNNKGKVPVAIFGSENFDVIDIEIVSMSLVGSEPIQVFEVPDKLHIEDLNEDGFDDAVLILDKADVCEATDPLTGTGDVELTGQTTDETQFAGIGDIRIVKR